MRCIHCRKRLRVTNTRYEDDIDQRNRSYHCPECNIMFYTTELVISSRKYHGKGSSKNTPIKEFEGM